MIPDVDSRGVIMMTGVVTAEPAPLCLPTAMMMCQMHETSSRNGRDHRRARARLHRIRCLDRSRSDLHRRLSIRTMAILMPQPRLIRRTMPLTRLRQHLLRQHPPRLVRQHLTRLRQHLLFAKVLLTLKRKPFDDW